MSQTAYSIIDADGHVTESLEQVTKYLDASGAPIPLAPGATWVELAPASVTGPGPIPVAQVTVGP